MPSTFTTLLNLEKPATSELKGTWGAVPNANMDILDNAVLHTAGVALVSGRVPYVTTGGKLKDEAALAYDEATDRLAVGSLKIGGDTFLERDAANVLALRDALNPQQLRVYGQFVDSANYRRGFISYDGGATLFIQNETLGSLLRNDTRIEIWSLGSSGDVRVLLGPSGKAWTFDLPGGEARFRPEGDNVSDIGAVGFRVRDIYLGRNLLMGVGGGYIEGVEIADPAAPGLNQGRAYFRDNGAGKTQYVVRFNTGAVQVLAAEP